MNYLVHPTYINTASDRLIMTVDPFELSTRVPVLDENNQDASFNGLIEAIYGYKYVAPHVADFSGDPADLVIDRTKAPELKANTNDGIASSLGKAKFTVAVDKLSTGATNDENAQSTRSLRPPTGSRGSKRKYAWLEDKENPGNDGKTSVATKRRKNVLGEKDGNKKTAIASNSIDEQMPFACPECRRRFKRRSNMNSHIETHQPNRVKPFPCPDCDKSFSRKHDCARHQANIHG
jgi:uncharacterized C2H2 Zn-finger protein